MGRGQLFHSAKPGDDSAFTRAVAPLTEKGGVGQTQIKRKLLVLFVFRMDKPSSEGIAERQSCSNACSALL